MKEKGLVSQSGVFFNFFLGLGIALSGMFIGKSVEQSVVQLRRSRASVVVKGLAERKVKSDEGEATVHFGITGNDLDALVKCSNENADALKKFFAENKIQATELSENAVRIVDFHSTFVPTKYNSTLPANRYGVFWSVEVKSSDVDKIELLYQRANEFLLNQTMKSKDLCPEFKMDRPHYTFNALEPIRAEIIAEATQSARKAAEQFAVDSKCKVGSIQHANQGSVNVDGGYYDKVKNIRLVTYITFNLI
ncbi:MAG: SIMPL domain-containing protein [Holosporales bacterium]|nr:SIMPL domain-containing protein [Holosporales bacterium]